MRISDWSSDVCSSDLQIAECAEAGQGERRRAAAELADRIAGGQIGGDVVAGRSLRALPEVRVHVETAEQQVKAIAETEQTVVEITGEAPFGADRKSTRLNSSH